MSLIRLLTVGRSLGTIRDEPSRYRMAQGKLLPRFGPVKAVENETVLAAMRPVPAPAGERVEAEEPLPAGITPSGGEKTNMKTEILEQSEKRAGNSTGFLRYVASPWKGWALLRNPLQGCAMLRNPLQGCAMFRNPFQGKSARHHPPIQAELALDMVKPVCNDLNDTDLELIPAGRAVLSAPKAGQAGPSTPQVGRAGLSAPSESVPVRILNLLGAWWGRLRNGLLKFRSRQT